MEPMGRGNSERLDQASCTLAINFNRHHGHLRHRCLCGLVGVHALAQLLREPDLALALAVNAYANHTSSSATAMATAAMKISACASESRHIAHRLCVRTGT
jgi:hypothetical protein